MRRVAKAKRPPKAKSRRRPVRKGYKSLLIHVSIHAPCRARQIFRYTVIMDCQIILEKKKMNKARFLNLLCLSAVFLIVSFLPLYGQGHFFGGVPTSGSYVPTRGNIGSSLESRIIDSTIRRQDEIYDDISIREKRIESKRNLFIQAYFDNDMSPKDKFQRTDSYIKELESAVEEYKGTGYGNDFLAERRTTTYKNAYHLREELYKIPEFQKIKIEEQRIKEEKKRREAEMIKARQAEEAKQARIEQQREKEWEIRRKADKMAKKQQKQAAERQRKEVERQRKLQIQYFKNAAKRQAE